jgi:zinc protease
MLLMRRAVAPLLAAGLLMAIPARTAEAPLGTVETVALENGLRLILAPDPAAPSVDLAVWYDAGSRYDHRGKSGIAHLFEHLMFRGSKGFASGEHVRRVRAEGGTSGAFATHDILCFYQTLPPQALELAFRLEADRMTGLELTEQALAEERRQVRSERTRRSSLAARIERLSATTFANHPYGLPVLGREEELAKVTLADLREFYRAHLGPSRAVVTVAGHFSREDAVGWARKYFGPLKPSGGRPSQTRPGKPQTEERRRVETHDAPLRVLMVGWEAPPRSDPDWPALSLLAAALTRATDAPLARALVVERPLCLSVAGDVESRRDASLFYLTATVHPDADSAEVESALLKELDRVLVQPVRAEDLERAKRQTETAAWFSLQTSRGRAQALGNGQMLAGAARDLERQLERTRAAQAADLTRAARRLDPARRNVLWLVPSDAGASRQ